MCKRISLNGCFRQDRASIESNVSTTVPAKHGETKICYFVEYKHSCEKCFGQISI